MFLDLGGNAYKYVFRKFFLACFRQGLDWYRSRMPNGSASSVIVEEAPNYFQSREVATRIRKQLPEMKLILLVSDPVHRVLREASQVSL